ncbi:hypothetical protein FHL15_003801 [Xylaria flabelliformis]|uniref:BRCT domain-containing protein n=1 Tax=Xylaria flabelliformis TaxID=2512241 RepID=A0A553I5J3_9PEZI|nr:hypothetical protein FHL15_003801 [Xylaria flabelliformis]
MTRSATWSLPAADRRALSGESDSQEKDSQEKLLFLLREYGIELVHTTTSPTLDDEPRQQSTKGFPSAPPTSSHQAGNQRPPQAGQNASHHTPVHYPNVTNAHVDVDTAVIVSSSSTSSRSPAPVTCSTPIPAQPDSRNVRPWDRPTSSQTRGHVTSRPLPLSGAPLKKGKTKTMSSQSLTQPNEGRSYEQYTQQGLQPSSPPNNFDEEEEEEPRTLHEGDTGYVDLRHPLDLPDTMLFEPDTPLLGDDEYDDGLRDPSQFTSQLTAIGTNHFAPETPATLPKPFLASGHGQVMPASQLFDQTQPTSGLRKASPTSSRPSPNVFGDNVASPSQPESSPLKNRSLGTGARSTYASTFLGAAQRSSQPSAGRTSRSPSPADASGAAEGRDEEETEEPPLPTLISRKSRGVPEPIAEYRPYRKRGLSSKATRSSSQHSWDSDFDRDDAELRRQRARWNKEKASRSFPDIRLPLPGSSRAKVEVPSTNRTRRSGDFARTDVAQRHGRSDATDHHGSQETVGDSQDVIAEQKKSTNETAILVPPARDHNRSLSGDFDRPSSVPVENVEDKEVIPETSPAPTFAEPPRLIGDLMRENSCASSGMLTLSYPTPSAAATTCIDPSSSLNVPPQAEKEISAPPVIDRRDTAPVAAASSSPSVVPASSQQSTKRRSSRLNNTTTPSSSTAPPPLLCSDPGTSSSMLTVLSTTPAISSSLTPSTTEDGHDAEPLDDTVSVPSPTVERGRRRRRPPSSLPNPSPSSTRPKTHRRPQPTIRRGTRQSSRHSSLSLDELDKSPSVSASEDFRSVARKSPRKSTTLREFQTKSGIFEGMVFAVSLQERQQPHRAKNKSLSKGSLEEMIRQEGGTVLDDGFSALFEFDTLPSSTKASSTPVLSSSLNLLDSGTGFAALIADGHSRKVKYMQALALGIPCLAPKWVTTCISKKETVDWSSYLLCAGSSKLLGDAIRSRNLQPYDASTARLAQVISQRPKLLNESKILLMMKKTKNEEKRLPYVFLAQVLGASLVRVHSIEEARAKLREAESENNAFDWVYVDDHLQDAKSALFGSTSSDGNSRKRKRTNTGADVGDQSPKRIRTLNDELVVQSLILGRLIEEDEMES